ncbi:hypothetical protein [Deinococcus cellulosilyticus]|uniref:Uncharacterized protein n=1 Tax=Deinococcus cellulosilyticus (strain DSM 18568 / NBRC 106333 / KACC 11606 / 5516J-15) TaxID=1223518 RepID=A0A511NAI2_DEIC1|nr:hypothetical protein [Deinococcus cellulosilyticus]GEM49835.1 hypothetical protein DC3_54700 [Deinococcus cellulosilyticus NBRC 106333 = KACC 11606]
MKNPIQTTDPFFIVFGVMGGEISQCGVYTDYTQACKAAVLWMLPHLESRLMDYQHGIHEDWLEEVIEAVQVENWKAAWSAIPCGLDVGNEWTITIEEVKLNESLSLSDSALELVHSLKVRPLPAFMASGM